MSEEAPEAATLTFNIKASTDQKHVVSVPESMTVLDLKQKLSTPEYADIPAERQRLIYSGRVMKDADPLSNYKIKDGNTVHMVKGAASNTARNAENSSASSAPASAAVPQNMASGTGNDPLAGLTGARYAGFAQMPGQDMFGPDGGMGPPQGPEELLRMLENPMFQSQMNEAMNNPQVIQMLQNQPGLRDQPMAREMLNNPEMRRMMTDPQFLRQSMQMSRMMGGAGMGGQGGGGMPAPGETNTTPGAQGQGQIEGAGAGTGTGTGAQANPFAMFGGQGMGAGGAGGQPNPFAMFGQPGMGGGQGGQQNPFAALFGNGGGMGAPATNPPAPSVGNADSTTTQPTDTTQQPNPSQPGSQPNQQPANPMMSMMQNPEMMRMAMNMMAGGGMGSGSGTGQDQNQNQNQQQPGFNPFAMLGGMGGMGSMGAQQPPDTRPPEEMFSEQLRQLNDMGFFDFDGNVRALRMAGGRVEGAVQLLLGEM